jgi:hypothetical protein
MYKFTNAHSPRRRCSGGKATGYSGTDSVGIAMAHRDYLSLQGDNIAKDAARANGGKSREGYGRLASAG